MDVGSKVGARRWPMFGSHPDTWERPYSGVVLAHNDVRAWEGTLAFNGKPTQAQVDAHLEWMDRSGLSIADHVPVLWAFKDRDRIIWERRANLRAYEADLVQWWNERAGRRAELRPAA